MDEVSLSLSALFTFFLTSVSNAGSFQCQSSLEVKNTPLPSAGPLGMEPQAHAFRSQRFVFPPLKKGREHCPGVVRPGEGQV